MSSERNVSSRRPHEFKINNTDEWLKMFKFRIYFEIRLIEENKKSIHP